MKPTQEQVVEWFNQSISHEKRYAGSTYRLAALAFAAGQASAIPEGWKRVPVEPTRQMLDAAHVNFRKDVEIDPLLKTSYRAMLAAAPSQETGK